MKIEWLLLADILEDKVVNVEVERIFACFLGKNNQVRVVADDFVKDDAGDSGGFPGRRDS